MSIPVIWWDGSFGNWDHGLLSEIFDAHPDVFIQHNTKEPNIFGRAIVVVTGKPSVEPLRAYLETLKSGVAILVSDEDGFFDWKAAIPPHIQVWTQYWTPYGKGEIKERILLGAPNRIKNYKINTHLPKKYLWSFIGQVQNPFRQACVDVLKTLPDGFLHIVPQFGGGQGGIEYQEYLDILCQSRYVFCPSGSMNCETFRMYEAMECGSIPITDCRSPRDAEGFNYWNEVYPEHNISYVKEWVINKETPWYSFIEYLMRQDLKFEHNKWWFDYKEKLEQKLLNYAKQLF